MSMPKDPVILLSYINTLLRDRYCSLDDLCEDAGIDVTQLRDMLEAIGYQYIKEYNQFR